MLPNYVGIIRSDRVTLTWHKPWCRAWECEVMGGWAAEYAFGWLYLAGFGFELSLRVKRSGDG